MKAPRAGSRKAAVYDVFFDKGLDAAIAHGLTLELKEGTVRSWAGGWAKGTKQEHTPVKTPKKLSREKATPVGPDMNGPTALGHKQTILRARQRVCEVGVGKHRPGRLVDLGGQVSGVKWETDALPSLAYIANINLYPLDDDVPQKKKRRIK